ncbi:LuxR C-terminal-related transcriptional regulator [Streptomyces sp. L2]|uniref:helix-turn-helix transcriptional regulator n=1 Tax=Streptomyces sp. L2 TaxID=2162665 RepID=UPI001F506AAE|nr:LuxR C-terminal-related transcriptional regulator [Streptomyces sp. L2]
MLRTDQAENVRGSDAFPRARIDRWPTAPGDIDAVTDLTPRELEVLLLLSEAASNRDIGRSLDIAERTVKAHVTNIMTKIKVTSRTEAALFAYAHHQRIAFLGERCTT